MKKFLPKAARFVFYLAGSAVILTPTVHAYVDPATTSYVVQIVAGIVIACGTGIGIFWNRMRRKVKKKKEDDPQQIVDNAERKTQGGVLTASDLLDDEAEKKDE